MKLNFTYNISPHRLLNDRHLSSRLKKMRNAGVETLYLFGYFYGTFESTLDELEKAKVIVENEGFRTGIINVPLGHGGNALDPSDPNINLNIGNGWRMTKNSDGHYCENTTCIDDVMIADTRKANQLMYDIGFRTFMNDDDLRQGSWGADIQGCFCDYCMEKFTSIYGAKVARKDIVSLKDKALTEAWLKYQCEKIPRFLLETTPAGAANGIMIMHNGDRRHGIDIPLIRKTMPDNLLFRVGEGHFDDRSFTPIDCQDSIERSIKRQLALIGDNDICYSETTVFPAEALSPENWIEKMKLEIRCGLRNLYLMSGTWFFTDPYWDALTEVLPELRELAETTLFPEPSLPEFSWVW